jgi:glycosyltransferase involved in cell wall biosynthesis
MVSIVVISKDEPALEQTLADVQRQALRLESSEVIVVDASAERLAHIQRAHPEVRWIDYVAPDGVAVSIPHQRNAGVRAASGEIIVFTDAGCAPRAQWLTRLIAPIASGMESVTAGVALPPQGTVSHYGNEVARVQAAEYLDDAPTINLAFRRDVFDAVDGFDERFEYGSDLDFTWRVNDGGFRIRSVPDAVVEHDWGTGRRQLRRAYLYGRAKGRLYTKHRGRRRTLWRRDPMVLVYPTFILGLPLTVLFPPYPLLLLVTLWRARGNSPVRVTADHLAFGAGVIATVAGR